MRTTTLEIQKQIAVLQAQLLEVRKSEVADAVARAQSIIEEFGLTIEDLFGNKVSVKTPAEKKERKLVAMKYRGPAGDTQLWTGRGVQPRWVREVKAAGKSIEEYLITGAEDKAA